MNYRRDAQNLREQLRLAERQGRKIYFMDEICFTKRSILSRDWSRANSNLSIEQSDIFVGYRAVIASMSEHWGIKVYDIKKQAITADDFAAYLKKMRASNFNRPLALFMDNLPVHKSNIVKPLYDSLNIMPIYNVSYSPELNPIEAVFSKVKAIFNRQRLNHLVNKTDFDADKAIRRAF